MDAQREGGLGAPLVGALFLAAAAMLWGGWTLLPHRIGTFFQPADFGAVAAHLRLWIWMFRVHLFGLVVAVMALAALAAAVADRPARLLVWPAAAVAGSGFLVTALAAAFYYHFGAWGAVAMAGAPPEAQAAHIASLAPLTEYVTCLVRFGRVFSGLGLAVLGIALVQWPVLAGGRWLGSAALGLGVAAMALTMALPDALDLYLPLFHLLCLWLAAVGAMALRRAPA
jgi:hypothetical protein